MSLKKDPIDGPPLKESTERKPRRRAAVVAASTALVCAVGFAFFAVAGRVPLPVQRYQVVGGNNPDSFVRVDTWTGKSWVYARRGAGGGCYWFPIDEAR